MTSPSESTELAPLVAILLDNVWRYSGKPHVVKGAHREILAFLDQEYSRGRREALKELLEFAYDPANGRATIITYLETKLKEPSND